MKPTEVLENEHRVIERVLSCLEKLTDMSEKKKKLDCDAARDMIDFFRVFADRFHHAKEERHLFAALETCGLPRDGGPTGVMLAEHELGRGFIGEMETAVNNYARGEVSALGDFVSAARAYLPLLREHIQKEDHCLFAMANENLSAVQQEHLLQALRDEEEGLPKDRGHDFYLKKALALAERFQIKPADKGPAPTCGSGTCSHH